MPTRISPTVANALGRFQTVEVMQLGYDSSHQQVRSSYASSLARAHEDLLEASFKSPVVRALGRAASEFAHNSEEGRTKPLFRLATYFLSRPSYAHGVAATDQNPDMWEARIAGGMYLSRSAEVVAADLEGETFMAAGHRAILNRLRAQDESHNRPFASRPVFGTERNDVYVARFRGHDLMYLRSGVVDALSCVAILGADVDGSLQAIPSKVSTALELPGEHVADVLLDSGNLVVSGLQARTAA